MKFHAAKSLFYCHALFKLGWAMEDYGTSQNPRQATIPVSTFGYDGLDGPLNWYGLNKSGNGLCDMGKQQSPINIDTKLHQPVNGSLFKFHIPNVYAAEFENIGTYVEVVVNGTLTTPEKKYELSQFHFHSPSEHRINNVHFPMEQHFVLEAADKTMAVVTFLIELNPTGFTGPLLDKVFSSVSAISKPGASTMTGPLKFSHVEKHFRDNTVYRYTGSLTSPPCTESVDWFISSKPLSINVKHYLEVKKILKFNSRYLQNRLGQLNLLENAAKELDG